MAEGEPCRPFMLLTDFVRNFSAIDDDDPRAYQMVECSSSKAAYGCGPNGDAIVRGLTLFVLVGGDDDDPYMTPELRLRATDEVFHRVESQFDVEKMKRCGSETRLSSRIYAVDGDVIVLRISFIPSFTADVVWYYLVYDSSAASLSLLPRLPRCCRPVCTDFPLKVKVKVKAGEEDKKLYSLVLMAERSTSPSAKYTDPVLCLWSPPPPPDNDARHDYNRRAWELKARVRVNAMADTFEAHTVFSCNRHAVWGDLAQGIVYCDLGDLTDDATEPVVFKHAMLPEECRIRYDTGEDPMRVFRTMSRVGDDSIWFVLIEPSFDRPGDTKVKVWTLDDLPSEEWSMRREFRMQGLFELEAFRAWGLPETAPPQFPFLRRRQKDDVENGAALYMFLREPYRGGYRPYAHLVCIDLSGGGSEVVRLVSSRRLVFPLMQRPIVLDPDFFDPPNMAVF